MAHEPGYDPHWRVLDRIRARWGLGRFQNRWFGNFVNPSVRLDRDWIDDETSVWGYSTSQPGNVGQLAAVAIEAGDRTVMIRRLEYSLQDAATTLSRAGALVHLSKALAPYDPTKFGKGQFFPFLNGDVSFTLPHCTVLGGVETASQSVQIGGFTINPAIGPQRWVKGFIPIEVSGFTFSQQALPEMATWIDWADPPMRIAPGETVFVQAVNLPPANEILNVNIWLSERIEA